MLIKFIYTKLYIYTTELTITTKHRRWRKKRCLVTFATTIFDIQIYFAEVLWTNMVDTQPAIPKCAAGSKITVVSKTIMTSKSP